MWHLGILIGVLKMGICVLTEQFLLYEKVNGLAKSGSSFLHDDCKGTLTVSRSSCGSLLKDFL